MKLSQLAQSMNWKDLTPELQTSQSTEITSGYVSDLLSDVLAHAQNGGVWITIQAHLNVLAVAVHANLAAVVFASDRKPDEAVIRRAVQEKVALYVSTERAFDIVGRLYQMGVRGTSA